MLAWAHNETSTGVMTPVAAPRRAPTDALVADRRDIGRRRPAGRRSPRPTPTTSRRRRASRSDGGLWLALLSPAAQERIAQLHGSAALDPAVPLAADGARELAQRPDLQHAGGRDAVPARRPDRWMLANGGLEWCLARTRASSEHLYGWAQRRRLRDAVRGTTRPSARWSSARSTSTTRVDAARRRRRAARQRDRRRRAVSQARPQPAAHRHVPRRRDRRRAGAHRLHRLGRREGRAVSARAERAPAPGSPAGERQRVLVKEKIGDSGVALLREHFDVDLGDRLDATRSSASGSATTRAS